MVLVSDDEAKAVLADQQGLKDVESQCFSLKWATQESFANGERIPTFDYVFGYFGSMELDDI